MWMSLSIVSIIVGVCAIYYAVRLDSGYKNYDMLVWSGIGSIGVACGAISLLLRLMLSGS